MDFVSNVTSLLFNMLSGFVLAFLPRSMCLLILWLQSLSAVILESKKIKSFTHSIVSPSICHKVMGPVAVILVFWMLSFKPTFSLSSFTFIKRLFSSSLSAIRAASSAYLKLWIFLLAILIPAHYSSSLTFFMMYSAYKLSKQGDDIQPWHTPFPILNQSAFPNPILTCCFLTCIQVSQETNKVVSYSQLFKNFPQPVVIHIVKGFSILNEAESMFFRKSLAFFIIQWILAIWSLVWSSKSSLHIWQFSVYGLLKPGLKDFWVQLCYHVKWMELYSSLSMLWHCLSLRLEWKLTFSRPLLSFPNLLTYWVKHFNSIIF